jgi:hypothetical protein
MPHMTGQIQLSWVMCPRHHQAMLPALARTRQCSNLATTLCICAMCLLTPTVSRIGLRMHLSFVTGCRWGSSSRWPVTRLSCAFPALNRPITEAISLKPRTLAPDGPETGAPHEHQRPRSPRSLADALRLQCCRVVRRQRVSAAHRDLRTNLQRSVRDGRHDVVKIFLDMLPRAIVAPDYN